MSKTGTTAKRKRINPHRDSVEDAARRMVQMYGDHAQMVAHHRADDTDHPLRHEFWTAVEWEIPRVE